MDLANSYYLWLLPDEPYFDIYHQTIADLAAQYKTPVFEPHVTLVSGLSAPESRLITAVSNFAATHKNLILTFHSIGYTHGFFTSLFLRAHLTPEADQLNQKARQALNPFSQTNYDPHLSLLYGSISPDEKQSIIETLHFQRKTISFSRLQLVRGHTDVGQWRKCGQWPLGERYNKYPNKHNDNSN